MVSKDQIYPIEQNSSVYHVSHKRNTDLYNFWKSRLLLLFYFTLFISVVGCLIFMEEIQLKAHGIYFSLFPLQPLDSVLTDFELKGFLIKTNGCRIPDLDPFDESVRPYFYVQPKLYCNNKLPPLVKANVTHLKLIESVLNSSYNVENPDSINCCYSIFERLVPKIHERDNMVKYKPCLPFQETVEIKEEFVKVICSNNKIIYTDYFSFAPSKTIIKEELQGKTKYNVLVVGIDAISRLNLYRQMPETINILKRLNAIELLGFNKVGDNTFPNLIPVLTGLNETELIATCWNTSHSKFDSCNFIWNDAKRNHFVTAFGEDSSKIGIFNYQKTGFMKSPTDYYWGPFSYASEEVIGNQDTKNTFICVGSRFIYQGLLDYILKFLYRMKQDNNSYFGFFWSNSISHDFLNLPQLADKDYFQFFQSLEKTKELKKTVVIFMSDHGIRWGGIRTTYQGQMEERLPFVYILLPESFKKSNNLAYDNLVKNTRKLTTMFDLHETIYDLLSIKEEKVQRKSHPDINFARRSYSLFEDIPKNRTCASAGIESHWCTCQTSFDISSNETVVIEAAHFAVKTINQQLYGYPDCAQLTLKKVLSARVHFLRKHLQVGLKYIQDYTIIFETQPGNGLFESTIRQHVGSDHSKYSFSLTGIISRINLYGSQSYCIINFHLKLYCYCIR